MTNHSPKLNDYIKLANAGYCRATLDSGDIDKQITVAQKSLLNAFNNNTSWGIIPIEGKEVTSSFGSFNGICYGKKTGEENHYNEVVVAFRGSQEALDWIPADFLILLNWKPSTQLVCRLGFNPTILLNY